MQYKTKLLFRRWPATISRAGAFGIAGLVLVVLWQIHLVGDWRVDDAYITFAFSKNVAQGRGPIFSHDVRVEGYTNFLWMLVNAVPIRLFPERDPLLAARLLAFACLGVLLWSTYQMARRFVGPTWAVAAALLLALWTDLTRAALSGLETIPFAALLNLGFLAYLQELEGQRRHSLSWFCAAAMTRISGITNLAFLLTFECARRGLQRRWELRSLARWGGYPLAVFLVYFGWRWSYYGLPFPTTYYAKSLVAQLQPGRGFAYLDAAMRDLGGYFLAPPLLLALTRIRDPRRVFLGTALLAEVASVVHVQGDWMPFNRFWIPIGGPVAVLFVLGLKELVDLAQARAPRSSNAVRASALAIWLVVAVHVDSHHVTCATEATKLARAAREKRHTYRNLFRERHYFAAITRRPGEVLATDYGGMFGYYTDASLIEMWGLCNVEIALRGNSEGINPIYGKTCIDCYAQFSPDYFHIKAPIVRKSTAFSDHSSVVDSVFQAKQLERVLDLRHGYATGRVLNRARNRALFFLEKRRPGVALTPRVVELRGPVHEEGGRAGGFIVDYPFEEHGSHKELAGVLTPHPDAPP